MILFMIMIVFSPITAIIPAFYAGYLVINKQIKVERNYWNIGLFLLFSWSLISAVINQSILSLLAACGVFLYLAIGVLAQKYFVNKSRISIVLKYLVYLTTIVALGSFMEKVAFGMIGMNRHRIFSTFGNPNMAGAWFASVILVILYLKENLKNKNDKIIYNLCLIIVVIALLLTESSGAIIALVCAIFAYYLFKPDKSFNRFITVGITVGIIGTSFLFLQDKVNSVSPINELVVSFNSRYDIWEGSLKMFEMKPVTGWGLSGTFEHGVDFMYNNGNSIHSHNIWLTFLTSTGIIGLAIYLYIKYNLIKDLVKLYKIKNPMVSLLIAVNVMVVIQGLVDCSLYAPQLGIMFICTGAVSYNLANNKMKNVVRAKKIISLVHENDIAV